MRDHNLLIKNSFREDFIIPKGGGHNTGVGKLKLIGTFRENDPASGQ